MCICELVPLFDVSQPMVTHHLKVLRDAGLVESEKNGLWAYHHVYPARSTRSKAGWRDRSRPTELLMATVLFVCLRNAGRSQMSEALFARAAAGRHNALSAGTAPAERVHPEVVEAMRELGIDLARRKPRGLSRELAEQADVVVTMGCGDECPYLPGKRYVDWDLPDPEGRPIAEVRATRDTIAKLVEALVVELDEHRNPS